MSGSAVHHWGLSSHKNHITTAFEMAKAAGHPKQDLNELIDWLKVTSAENFVGYSRLVSAIDRTFALSNAPVVESKLLSFSFVQT